MLAVQKGLTWFLLALTFISFGDGYIWLPRERLIKSPSSRPPRNVSSVKSKDVGTIPRFEAWTVTPNHMVPSVQEKRRGAALLRGALQRGFFTRLFGEALVKWTGCGIVRLAAGEIPHHSSRVDANLC